MSDFVLIVLASFGVALNIHVGNYAAASWLATYFVLMKLDELKR